MQDLHHTALGGQNYAFIPHGPAQPPPPVFSFQLFLKNIPQVDGMKDSDVAPRVSVGGLETFLSSPCALGRFTCSQHFLPVSSQPHSCVLSSSELDAHKERT